MGLGVKLTGLRWKVMVFTPTGVYFSTEKHLSENAQDAQWFDNYAAAVERSQDIVALNVEGVTQVRIISSAF